MGQRIESEFWLKAEQAEEKAARIGDPGVAEGWRRVAAAYREIARCDAQSRAGGETKLSPS